MLMGELDPGSLALREFREGIAASEVLASVTELFWGCSD